ncbi:hypothetical protein EW026_g8018 [Hermanssonia centrifuga]|uniref:Uncharacterized protein n=1 Tax=Hermanssonia centrifuga TaxID=98765 RepID=A0A4S4K5U7_9APHY|nr:hypothetical protein EW026_g8018 [Hermanssonia centrifuga]
MSATEKAVVPQTTALDRNTRGIDDEVAKRMLAILRELEGLGGSSALEVWLKERGKYSGILPSMNAESTLVLYRNPGRATTLDNWEGAKVDIYSILAYTHVDVTITGTGVSGSGGAWGPGLGAIWGIAYLRMPGQVTLDQLKSRVTNFMVVAGSYGGGGASLLFFATPFEILGEITGVGGGLGAMLGFKGSFKFS